MKIFFLCSKVIFLFLGFRLFYIRKKFEESESQIWDFSWQVSIPFISGKVSNNISNVMRISNYKNRKATFNFVNCNCESWEDDKQYGGYVCCQDNLSASKEAANEANWFGKDKITLNFTNCTGPHGKIANPTNLSEICGSKDDKQLVYVYRNHDDENSGLLAYESNADKFPTIIIR